MMFWSAVVVPILRLLKSFTKLTLNCTVMVHSTAASYLILAGTGFKCIRAYNQDSIWNLPNVSYVAIIFHSVVGIIHHGILDEQDSFGKAYNLTGFLQNLVALPCVAIHVGLEYKHPTVASCLLFISLLPLVFTVLDRAETRERVHTAAIVVDGTALATICHVNGNKSGVAVALIYTYIYFVVRTMDGAFLRLPPTDWFNYGLCLVCYFVLGTITGITTELT